MNASVILNNDEELPPSQKQKKTIQRKKCAYGRKRKKQTTSGTSNVDEEIAGNYMEGEDVTENIQGNDDDVVEDHTFSYSSYSSDK